MTRRDFVKHLALLAAGAAALPAQVAAFERYYDINMPRVGGDDLLAVDEIYLSGYASRSMPVGLQVTHADRLLLNLGFNAFGGIILWRAQADSKLLVRESVLRLDLAGYGNDAGADPVFLANHVGGHISFLRQDGVRETLPLRGARHTVPELRAA